MFNSLLMLGSTYSKNRKVNLVFAIGWITLMLLGSNFQTGTTFIILNFVAFALVFALGFVFKGKYSNKVVAISSILIWSVTIDIMSYFLFPQFRMGQTMSGYISNGILFNYKFLFTNLFVVGMLSIVPMYKKILAIYRKKATQ